MNVASSLEEVETRFSYVWGGVKVGKWGLCSRCRALKQALLCPDTGWVMSSK